MTVPPTVWIEGPPLLFSLFLEPEKRDGRSLVAASDPYRPTSHLFHIHDKIVGTRFLVDTGTEVSIIPASFFDCRSRVQTTSLQAVNASPIKTYDKKSLTLNLGLRRRFQWLFWIADVSYAIIGANFFQNFNIWVDMTHRRLIDATTHLQVSGIASQAPALSPTFSKPPSNSFASLLEKYPDLIKPHKISELTKLDITHHIVTTGPPVHCRPR
ncbi:unnamed protein product [Ixodes persulcatus]